MASSKDRIPGSHAPQQENVAERWLFRALLALLLWVPLPLGSNRLWSWSVMEMATTLLLAAWIGYGLLEYRRHQRVWWSPDPAITQHRLAILLLLTGALYPLWQIIPWSEPTLAILSPATLALRHDLDITAVAGPISQDVHATLTEWLKNMAYLGAFWLTLILTISRQNLLQLTWILLGSGTMQLGFGLLSPHSRIIANMSGTFVNRNHLAGFLELLLPIAIGLLLHEHRSPPVKRSWEANLHKWLTFLSDRRGIVAGLGLAMLLALFMTQSRSGNASLFVSLLVMSGLFRWRRHRLKMLAGVAHPNTSQSTTPIVYFLQRFALLVAFLVISSWIGLGHLMERYMTTDVHQEERWEAFISATHIIGDYPLFGSGSGTFAFIFPRYQNEKLADTFYNHAHNDHLETLADRGIVGYGLLAAGISACWLSMLRAYLRRRDPLAASLLFATLAATLTLLLHGLTDFNFQIPANAMYFMVLLAVGLRSSVIRASRRSNLLRSQ